MEVKAAILATAYGLIQLVPKHYDILATVFIVLVIVYVVRFFRVTFEKVMRRIDSYLEIKREQTAVMREMVEAIRSEYE